MGAWSICGQPKLHQHGLGNSKNETNRGTIFRKEKREKRSVLALAYTRPDDKELLDLAKQNVTDLCAISKKVLEGKRSNIITFSPKVFLPLTRLCRDSCGYCTFAQPPRPGRRAYMTLEEIFVVAQEGATQGCAEALFTLGDKPELLYPEAKQELRSMGYESTLEYVAEASRVVLQETGLLPHVNAGVMTQPEIEIMKTVTGSQGLMLETASARLMQPGMPHHNCPDKEPKARLDTIKAAGRAKVPYTSGLLVGIGETREERVEALLQLLSIHQQYGHIQELIIQNFQPKKGTQMAGAPATPLEELLWTIALARLIFGPGMNIQAPPNLAPGLGVEQAKSWSQLLQAGINDFGGISPVTRDYVNPEKPWPHLTSLAETCAESGMTLVPRLTLYPEYALESSTWLDFSLGRKSVATAVIRQSDVHGLLRGSTWAAGHQSSESVMEEISNRTQTAVSEVFQERTSVIDGTILASDSGRATPLPRMKRGNKAWHVTVAVDGTLDGCSTQAPPQPHIAELLTSVLNNQHELTEDEIVSLFDARGQDFSAICSAAVLAIVELEDCRQDARAIERRCCDVWCCAEYQLHNKGKLAEHLRGAAYLLPMEEIARRTSEAWDRGASEVCMQGGIHPDFNGYTYLKILETAKLAVPDIHVHAFSPLEVTQGARTLGWTLEKYLRALKEAGLGSLPGTAAEVLDDQVRATLCPDKLNTNEWLEVIETAHEVGLKTTSTIMFGHCDTTRSWARHLVALRGVQSRTFGITEFVPLPFVHMEAPIYLKEQEIGQASKQQYLQGKSRRGPTLRECYLMHSIARLALAGYINNIQASWPKMGPHRAVSLMKAGCNDMGGTLMNESITRAAGASHGQELPPERMEELIRSAGRTPRQRNTPYESVLQTQTAKSFGAAPLEPLDMDKFAIKTTRSLQAVV